MVSIATTTAKNIKLVEAEKMSWQIKPSFKLPEFWKPVEGNYVVEIDLRQFNFHKGNFGDEIWFRIKVNQREFVWSIPVAKVENNTITVTPGSRAYQLKEIIEKYGARFHKLFIKVSGENRERKYTIEHLSDCPCKKEDKT